jgi:HK97 family phage portal protein
MDLRFWKRPPKKKAQTGLELKSTSIFNISNDSFLAFALGGGTYVTSQKAMTWYQTNSAVATAVDKIAKSIEQITPVLQTEDGKFIDAHEVLDLLNDPNDFQSYQDFIGQIARHWLLKHDSYMTAAGNVRTRPVELFAPKLQNVYVTQSKDLRPASYNVTQGDMPGTYQRQNAGRVLGTRYYDGTLKELMHIKGFSSRATEIDGDSPLQAAATETKQVIEGRAHNLRLIENGGYLSLLIAFKDSLGGIGDDEHQARVQSINEQLGGSNNAGKIAVMSEADISELRELGQTNKDMNFEKLDETAALAIYTRYDIPLPLVSMKAATFRNMETAIEVYYDMAVLPNADTIFAGLSRFLLPRYKLDPAKVQITYNPESIKELRQRQLDELEQRKKINIETTNELRQLLPSRERLEGGDTFYQPATLVPVGEDEFTNDDDESNLEGAENE